LTGLDQRLTSIAYCWNIYDWSVVAFISGVWHVVNSHYAFLSAPSILVFPQNSQTHANRHLPSYDANKFSNIHKEYLSRLFAEYDITVSVKLHNTITTHQGRKTRIS